MFRLGSILAFRTTAALFVLAFIAALARFAVGALFFVLAFICLLAFLALIALRIFVVFPAFFARFVLRLVLRLLLIARLLAGLGLFVGFGVGRLLIGSAFIGLVAGCWARCGCWPVCVCEFSGAKTTIHCLPVAVRFGEGSLLSSASAQYATRSPGLRFNFFGSNTYLRSTWPVTAFSGGLASKRGEIFNSCFSDSARIATRRRP